MSVETGDGLDTVPHFLHMAWHVHRWHKNWSEHSLREFHDHWQSVANTRAMADPIKATQQRVRLPGLRVCLVCLAIPIGELNGE